MGGRADGVVGREHELEAVERFLADSQGTLVLEGDPGIGKTTIWAVGVELARAAGRRVLVARPAEAETALPFAVLGDLLEPVVDEATASMPEPQRRALDIALVRREPEGASHLRAVAAAVLTALRTLAQSAPVHVAVDDMQWVDASSADALGYALRRVGDDPIQLLGTRRVGSEAGLVLREAVRVAVEPLGRDEIGRILATRLGEAPRRAALERIWRRSGGNPFFALELARDGRLADDPDAPLPRSLDVALRARLAAAPRATRDVLALAAAHPAPTPELLEHAGAARSALEDALALDLLVVDGPRVRFSHPLIGSAALSAVTAQQRRELHARLASALTDRDERAPHLARAMSEADEDVASELAEAASRALRRGATSDAAELAAHAVRLTPPANKTAARQRTLALADLLAVNGDLDAACARVRRLLDDIPPGVERARVRLKLADLDRSDLDVTARTYEEAIAEGDSGTHARGLLGLAHVRTAQGRLTEAATLADEAVPFAELAGEPETLSDALVRLADLRWSRGEGIDEEAFRRAIDVLPSPGGPPSLGPAPELAFAEMLALAGEHWRARPLLEKYEAIANEFGDERALGDVLAIRANLECRVGNPDAATAFADRAVELARRLHEPLPLAYALYWRGRVRALLGLVESSTADVEEAFELTERAGNELFAICCVDVLGYLALSTERLDAAQDHLEEVLAWMRRLPWREPAPVDAHHHLAEVHVTRGDLDSAEAVLDELEAVVRPLGRVRSLAGAVRVRGLVAAARGELDAAVALLDESLSIQARLPEPHESGRTMLHLGVIYRRANRKRAAQEALQEAIRLLDGCGAALWAQRARAELDRISGRPLRAGALTATERQIADLVAAGRSNHEVAHALSLSPKTVEWNLSKIYRKLHVRSRSELGAKLRKQAV